MLTVLFLEINVFIKKLICAKGFIFIFPCLLLSLFWDNFYLLFSIIISHLVNK